MDLEKEKKAKKEKEMREKFQEEKNIFNKMEKEIIFPFLKKEFGINKNFFYLYHGIDQFVDIYAYLVGFKYVIEFDISTIDESIHKNEIITVEDYKNRLSGKGRLKKQHRDQLNEILSNKDKD